MIDWVILNYLNKQKYKKCLLIVDDLLSIKKYINNDNITVIETHKFLDHYPENAYAIIATWEILSKGTATNIYTYLAKMNHNLRDDGEIFLRVIQNQTHLIDYNSIPFCWNIGRIHSIGTSKALKLKNSVESIITKYVSFLRFKYIPNV